jgi:WD40 repeat protein
VTTSRDHTARVWRLAGGSEPLVLKGHTGVVVAAAWSADGSLIVTASEDQTARVWSADTGAEVTVLEHEGGVSHVVFAPDGQHIATATGRQISFFRADGTGEPTRILLSKTILALAFVNEGRELLVVGPKSFLTTLVLDVALSKERLRASNTECLSIAMRSTYLGEKEGLAEERYAACEREHHRTPHLSEEVSP